LRRSVSSWPVERWRWAAAQPAPVQASQFWLAEAREGLQVPQPFRRYGTAQRKPFP
jgi:hypothetical protein